MSEERKKPGMAFWATVAVVVLLFGYPLSFGPARSLIGPRQLLRDSDPLLDAYRTCYRPIFWAMENPLIYGAMERYCALWERGRL